MITSTKTKLIGEQQMTSKGKYYMTIRSDSFEFMTDLHRFLTNQKGLQHLDWDSFYNNFSELELLDTPDKIADYNKYYESDQVLG
tara:strand:- start:302 stop:556 length:255 start_codon:yes stop_codon:yes gene_type:complete